MLTDPWFYAAAVPAMVLLGLGKGGFAGASMLAVPILAFSIPPLQAAVVILPVLLVQDALTVWNFRQAIDWTTLRYLLPASVVGQGIAFGLAANVNADALRIGVGLTAVVFAAVLWFGRQRRLRAAAAGGNGLVPHARGLANVMGALSGFTSFIVHAGSPPFNVYALPRLASPILFTGTASIFFAFQNIIKLPSFFQLGLFSVENFKLSLALTPFAVAANLAGIWLIRRINPGPFFIVIIGLMVMAGLKLIWDGAAAFL